MESFKNMPLGTFSSLQIAVNSYVKVLAYEPGTFFFNLSDSVHECTQA